MTQPFLVTATGRFERELKKLAAYHPTLQGLFRRVIDILKADPHNRSRQHPIIDGQIVYLKACSFERIPTKDGDRLVILIGGGTKKRQNKDIQAA